MWHYLKEILIFFASIPSSFHCKTQPALSASKYFRCLLPLWLYKVCFRTSSPWHQKEFICQDQQRLICSWPAPEDSVVLVPSWHLMSQKCSTSGCAYPNFNFSTMQVEKQSSVRIAVCCWLHSHVCSVCILVLHTAPTRASALHLPLGCVPLHSKLVALASSHFRSCFEST